MANIFSLFGEIFIDNEKANKSIEDTTKKGKDSSKSFLSNLGSVAKSAAKVGAAVVGATTATVGGLMAMANSSTDTADEIDKGSIRMGISTKSYQELKYAAGQCGVEMSAMEKAAKKLEDTDINMQDAMDQIMGLTTAEERAKKASELFGDNIAYTLSPLIEQSTEDYKGLITNANELGIVMGEDAVNAGVVFGDTLSDLKQSFGGIFNQLTAAFIPVLTNVLNLIIDNMPVISGIVSSVSPVITSLLESLLPPLMDLAATIFPILINLINTLLPPIVQIVQAILPLIVQLLNMILPPVIQVVDMLLPLLIQLITPLLPLLQPILNLLQPFINLLVILLQPLTTLLNMLLPPLIELFSTLLRVILPPLQKAFELVAKVLSTVFKSAFENIKPVIDNIKGVFKGITDFVSGVFTGNWRKAWDGVVKIFSNIFDGIKNIFKIPINFIIDGINIFLKGLNKLKIPDWIPGIGGKGINIPLIKKLRVGIDYVPYDEMPALLHKGERVLTADENKEYNGRKITEQTNINYNNQIIVEKLEVREESDIKRIAEELLYLQKKGVMA